MMMDTKEGDRISDGDGDIALVVHSDGTNIIVVYEDYFFGDYGVVNYANYELTADNLNWKATIISTTIPATKLAKRLYPDIEEIDGYLII